MIGSSPTFALATLGCKVNQYESGALIASLSAKGFRLLPFSTSAADLYLVNTCTVTSRADHQCRQLIGRAHRQNPQAPVIVTGCYAEVSPEEVMALAGVRMCLGNRGKGHLVETISRYWNEGCVVTGDPLCSWSSYFPPPAPLPARTRITLKVQDGCESFCSYCIVPYARGPIRSLPPHQVVTRIASLVSEGYQEVTITGIHLGAYGRDLADGVTLTDLVATLASQFPQLRLRLSSLEPREVTPRLLSLLRENDGICPHLHLPLQSGDDEVLRRMNRNYDVPFIRELIHSMTAKHPTLAVGADIMVGFPGEDQAAFTHTYTLLEELPLAYLHVFPYSPRPGTPAATFPHQIAPAEKKTTGGGTP